MSDLDRDDLLRELRNLRPSLEREGVVHLALFGSRARRDHRPDSDIDLLVDLDETRDVSLLDIIGISHAVEDRTGLTANIFVRRSLEPSFAEQVKKEGMPVF